MTLNEMTQSKMTIQRDCTKMTTKMTLVQITIGLMTVSLIPVHKISECKVTVNKKTTLSQFALYFFKKK
jgi:hypothetical protein